MALTDGSHLALEIRERQPAEDARHPFVVDVRLPTAQPTAAHVVALLGVQTVREVQRAEVRKRLSPKPAIHTRQTT